MNPLRRNVDTHMGSMNFAPPAMPSSTPVCPATHASGPYPTPCSDPGLHGDFYRGGEGGIGARRGAHNGGSGATGAGQERLETTTDTQGISRAETRA